ncbi:surface lipoprotein assembly modifier [Aliidiomarina soli]|nr:surface lipoprotein assembly modifier [Aliidiomarina soli]
MRLSSPFYLFLATLFMGAPVYAQQGEGKPELSYTGSLQTSYEHHSNISVVELDTAINDSDSALALDLNLDASLQLNQRTRVDAGYGLSERQYTEYPSYDLRTHLLYVDASHDVASVTIGANHYYADALLAREGFMSLNQSSLYAARLFGNQWYVRTSVLLAHKRFDELAERSADATGVMGNLFWFSNDAQRFVSLGLSLNDEDAVEDEFSYSGWALRLGVSQRMTLWQRDARLQLNARWVERDYQAESSWIEVVREDTQLLAEAQFSVALFDWLSAVTQLERGRYRSTLPTADYAETRLAVGMRASF